MVLSPPITRRFTSSANQPTLTGVRVTGDLRGLAFEAQVEQRFRNTTDEHLEVVYTLPLPHGAVLMGVEVVLGGKRLTGAVVERRAAEASYEEALAEGDAAIMLERNHDLSYTLNLGNLAPAEDCVVTLRYAQTLRFEQRGLRLMLPTVIAPRYGNPVVDGGLRPHQVPTHDFTAEYPFELTLQLHGDLTAARVASPSHPIAVASGATAEGKVTTVSLARRGCLDRDFVLVVDQLAHESVAVVARDAVDPEAATVLASFCPRLAPTTDAPLSVKILVDCSGSMGGDSITAAKRALVEIVAKLEEADRFSLSAFGSTVQHLHHRLWPARAAARGSALLWIKALDANLGGTEMEAALASTFALGDGAASDVLILTDGQINAIDATLATAKRAGHRIFAVGIGSSPAESLLRRLAEATGGACDFVAPGEDIAGAVVRMFTRLRSPRLTDLRIEWPEGTVPRWATTPSAAVFDGDTVSVFAQFDRPPTGVVRLLGARTHDGPVEEIARSPLSSVVGTSDIVSRLAVAERVAILAGMPSTSDEAVRLAVDYRLVTDRTNFLLVHERAAGEKAATMPRLEKIEQMVPAGWAGTADARLGSMEEVLFDSFAMPCLISDPSLDSMPTGTHDLDLSPLVLHKKSHRVVASASEPSMVSSFAPTGLSPFDLAEWLRNTPSAQWPTSFEGLRSIGLHPAVVDWLQSIVSGHPDGGTAEGAVVAAFLFVMSRAEVFEALRKARLDASVMELVARTHRDGLDQQTLGRILADLIRARGDLWPESVISSAIHGDIDARAGS
jgi:Ca-activated chloride channel homolog